MPSNVIERVWKRGKLIQIDDLKGIVCQSEEEGHIFRISGMDADGSVLPFSGTVSAVFLRPDMTDVAIAGSMAGGVASVTLPDECYDVPGRFGLTVYVSEGDAKTAVYAAVGTIIRTSTGTVAPESTADVVDLINRLTAIIATIPESMPGLMADIAPTYSASAVYPVGAYCYYNGDLHRCIVPITSAESWNQSHWETAVIGNDLKGLADDLEAETEERKAADWDIQRSVYETKSTTATEITDAVPMPLESLALAMAPKQDLNGYDKPWVGGAGKNKYHYPYAHTTKTVDGITWTDNGDGSITANGTAESANAYFNLTAWSDDFVPLLGTPGTELTITGGTSSIKLYTRYRAAGSTTQVTMGLDTGNGATFTVPNEVNTYISYFRIDAGVTVENVTLWPMIRLSSETDATWQPYENICPISGWDTVKVERTGKNLFDPNIGWTNGLLDDDGNQITGVSKYTEIIFGILPNTEYTLQGSVKLTDSSFRLYFRTSDGGWIQRTDTLRTVPYTFTTPSNCGGIQLQIVQALNPTDIQLEKGSEATAYEPYQGQTIIHNVSAAAGGTVYGGTLTVNRDGTGTLVVDKGVHVCNGSEGIEEGPTNGYMLISSNANSFMNEFIISDAERPVPICSHYKGVPYQASGSLNIGDTTTYLGSSGKTIGFKTIFDEPSEFKSYLTAQHQAGTPVTFILPLATPQTYTLTTEQITTLLGYNHITSDAEITGLAYYAVKAVEVDLSGKADKNNPVIYGSLSLGRNILSTVGFQSTALGSGCTASETASHAIGYATIASGSASHAEGNETEASGPYSHAEGNKTIANHSSQHVFGEYNIPDDSADASYQTGNYIEIVGNGTSYARSNARTLDWLGNEKLAGSITIGMGTADEVTLTPAQLKRLLALLT